MTPAFLAAMGGLGFKRNDDFNGANSEGYGPRQGTIANGRRVSTATAYLRPASQRSNLAILTNTSASEILIDNRRAIGVEVVNASGKRRLAARREVIVAGGAILSPQLLMLSGIGGHEELRSVGIEVKHHLPGVGANYHDHLAVAVLMEMRNTESYGISWRAAPRDILICSSMQCFAAGPWPATCSRQPASYVRSPALEAGYSSGVSGGSPQSKHIPFPLGHGFAISIVGLYPKSRGRVRLASSDPRLHPWWIRSCSVIRTT